MTNLRDMIDSQRVWNREVQPAIDRQTKHTKRKENKTEKRNMEATSAQNGYATGGIVNAYAGVFNTTKEYYDITWPSTGITTTGTYTVPSTFGTAGGQIYPVGYPITLPAPIGDPDDYWRKRAEQLEAELVGLQERRERKEKYEAAEEPDGRKFREE